MNNNKQRKQSRTIIGVDLGDRKHAVCVTDKDGAILEEKELSNSRSSLRKFSEDYPGALIAMEVGTHSPWISRLFEKLGHEVIVANARKLKAIYQNDRKCDRFDARILAKLVRIDPDFLHPIKHGTEGDQRALVMLKSRQSLVRRRVEITASVRGVLKSLGLRMGPGSHGTFRARLEKILAEEEQDLLMELEPSLVVIEVLNEQIKVYDTKIKERIAGNQQAQQLQEVNGVGPVTALSFVLMVGDVKRFRDPRDVGAYLGLVPRRDQSGGVDKELSISKAGNTTLRCLLVQCAQYILGPHAGGSRLREGGLKLAARGGRGAKKKAVIATARKLSVMMVVMLQKGSRYEPYPGQAAKENTRAEVA